MTIPVDLEKLAKAMCGDDFFTCPHCLALIDTKDCEVSQHIVSYWGDDLHDFSCDECGEDFVVKETVTRHFDAAKTADDFR